MNIENLKEPNAENMKRRKMLSRQQRNRSKNTRLVMLLLFCAILLASSMTGCIYFAGKYYALQDQTQEVFRGIPSETPGIAEGNTAYSQEQLEGFLSQAQEEGREQLLQKLKETMEGGETTVAMLRQFYPDELVLVSNKRYYFFPISDTLKKHSYLNEKFQLNEAQQMEYVENGQSISKKGIDVSKYQEDIEWQKVKDDNVAYAFVRLGLRGYESGKVVLDEKFEQNMQGASAVGIGLGAYFVTQAINEQEALEEAEFVIENLKPYQDKVNYPVAIDIEEVASSSARTAQLTAEARTKLCITFLERIKEAGYQPMIYGNLKSFLMLLDMNQLEAYPKWFANYSQPVYFPYEFDIWQYTDKGKVNGIEKGVDLNIGF